MQWGREGHLGSMGMWVPLRVAGEIGQGVVV
jgi:hypothetical protein